MHYCVNYLFPYVYCIKIFYVKLLFFLCYIILWHSSQCTHYSFSVILILPTYVTIVLSLLCLQFDSSESLDVGCVSLIPSSTLCLLDWKVRLGKCCVSWYLDNA